MMKRVVDRSMTGALAQSLLLALLLLFSFAQAAQAQNEGAQEAAEQNSNLADELRLTPEQIGRIAAIREQTKEERRQINQRLRRAQRALEEAIYSDSENEALIDERVRELSAAQAESTRLRTRTELNIRRVLRPEQLTALRELRARAQLRQERNLRSLDGALRQPGLGPRGGGRRGDLPRRARP